MPVSRVGESKVGIYCLDESIEGSIALETVCNGSISEMPGFLCDIEGTEGDMGSIASDLSMGTHHHMVPTVDLEIVDQHSDLPPHAVDIQYLPGLGVDVADILQ